MGFRNPGEALCPRLPHQFLPSVTPAGTGSKEHPVGWIRKLQECSQQCMWALGWQWGCGRRDSQHGSVELPPSEIWHFFPLGSEGAGILCLAGINLGQPARIFQERGQTVTLGWSRGQRAALAHLPAYLYPEKSVESQLEEAVLS